MAVKVKSKQEEIREGIAVIQHEENPEFTNATFKTPNKDDYDVADTVLKYLHSQGCVLKVEGELPTRMLVITRSLQEAYEQAERDMLKAGYTAWEPLIK